MEDLQRAKSCYFCKFLFFRFRLLISYYKSHWVFLGHLLFATSVDVDFLFLSLSLAFPHSHTPHAHIHSRSLTLTPQWLNVMISRVCSRSLFLLHSKKKYPSLFTFCNALPLFLPLFLYLSLNRSFSFSLSFSLFSHFSDIFSLPFETIGNKKENKLKNLE